jgi:hypothetical protein
MQPVTVQHVSAEVQVAPPLQLHDWGIPQLSATETLHWLPHSLAGAQHEWLLLHSSPAWHPAPHVTCWPQLFVTVTPPQRPAHAMLFGVQQRLSKQTSPLGQMVDGQDVCWLQLFMTVTLHWLPHAAPLSGMQHVLFGRHTCPLAQLGVLACPQLTVRLQLLVTWPHCWLPHAVRSDSGAQPHTLLVQVPLSHVLQLTVLPQLSVVVSQRPLHQSVCDTHTHVFWALQLVPVGQSGGQMRAWLQLSGPVPQCVLHQLGSDEHASPASAGRVPASAASSPSGASPIVASLPGPVSVGVALASPSAEGPVPPSPLMTLVVSDDASIGLPGSIPRMLPQARGAAHTSAPSATRPNGKQSRILSTVPSGSRPRQFGALLCRSSPRPPLLASARR